MIEEAIRSGAEGNLQKTFRDEELLTLLSEVANKERASLDEGHRRANYEGKV